MRFNRLCKQKCFVVLIVVLICLISTKFRSAWCIDYLSIEVFSRLYGFQIFFSLNNSNRETYFNLFVWVSSDWEQRKAAGQFLVPMVSNYNWTLHWSTSNFLLSVYCMLVTVLQTRDAICNSQGDRVPALAHHYDNVFTECETKTLMYK